MRRAREDDYDGGAAAGRDPPPPASRRVRHRGGALQTADLRPLFEEARKRRSEATAAEASLKRVRPRVAIACAPPESHDTDQGDANLAGIMRTLEAFGMRSEDQKHFHNMFIEASLPHIYGGRMAWPQVAERVMERMKIGKIQSEVFVLTPRRWGKTTSVAMFVAAVMLNVPGITVAVYSVAKRASGGVMSKVCEYINMIEGAKERVIVRNQEQLFIAERAPQPGVSRATLVDDKRTSKFWSFPASADRGLPSFFLLLSLPALSLLLVQCLCVLLRPPAAGHDEHHEYQPREDAEQCPRQGHRRAQVKHTS